jgi:hypothetical protein
MLIWDTLEQKLDSGNSYQRSLGLHLSLKTSAAIIMANLTKPSPNTCAAAKTKNSSPLVKLSEGYPKL